MKNPISERVSPFIAGITPYKPGKPIEELKREKGLTRIVKLASNENPCGPSKRAVEALERVAWKLHRYPDGYGYELKQALSTLWCVSPEELVLGNGSSEIIEMMVRLFVRPGLEVVLASPSFSIYELTTIAQGGAVVNVPLKNHRADLLAVAAAVNEKTALVILGNPNNPTGTTFSRSEWEAFLSVVPKELPILLDEAYAEYADDPGFFNGRDYIGSGRPVVALRTFSKAYGLAALRLGYGIAPREIVGYMNRLRLPFNANLAAQEAALAALSDAEHLRRSVEINAAGRRRLTEFFAAQGCEVIPSQANYVTAKVGDGDRVFEALLGEGVITRSVRGFGMPEWLRVTVGLPEELDLFEEAFRRVRSAGA